MLILNPVKSVLNDLLIPDLKEHPIEWLKFLFVESPIGWIGVGIVTVQLFLIVSTILYWL